MNEKWYDYVIRQELVFQGLNPTKANIKAARRYLEGHEDRLAAITNVEIRDRKNHVHWWDMFTYLIEDANRSGLFDD